MNIGTCPYCRQSAELHEGVNGVLCCEDCLVRGGLDKEVRAKEYAVRREVKEGGEEYIEYIIGNARGRWINGFITKLVADYEQRLRQGYGWINELKKIEDKHILMRMAVEIKRRSRGKGIQQRKVMERLDGRGKEDKKRKESGRKSVTPRGISRDKKQAAPEPANVFRA